MTTRVQLQEAFKLALSISLYFAFALWMDWDLPYYGALAIAVISLDTSGATIQKGLARVVGTTFGLLVALVEVGLFSQAPAPMLIFLSVYLAWTAYRMQGSRFGYAWFLAAFLPPLVWTKSYQNESYTFHYAVFRYLETTAGVTLYTLVCTLLWPRCAGTKLDAQGTEAWRLFHGLFGSYRKQIQTGEVRGDDAEQRRKLIGVLNQMRDTLDVAYMDTPAIFRNRRVWEGMRVSVRGLLDSLNLWTESIPDVRPLQTTRIVPGLGPALETIECRFANLGEIWAGQPTGDAGNEALSRPVSLEVDSAARASLSHFDRAALMAFLRQLRAVDHATLQVQDGLRAIRGFDPPARYEPPRELQNFFRPAQWRPDRLKQALFVSACLLCAYATWYFLNPPGGPENVFFAALFPLIIVRTPMDPRLILKVALVLIVVILLPVYVFVLPAVTKGTSLVTIIFVYVFVFRMLGAYSPVLSVTPTVLFVSLTGISNHQQYSFQGILDGLTMMVLALWIVTVVYLLVMPTRPESVLVQVVRGFFRGCSTIATNLDSFDRKHRDRRWRYFESMVLPAPAKLQSVSRRLDNRLVPDQDPERLQRLIGALESISMGLGAVELAHQRLGEHRRSVEPWVSELATRAQAGLGRVFQQWGHLDTEFDLAREQGAIDALAKEVEERLDSVSFTESPTEDDVRWAEDLYASLGSVRGLARSMSEAQEAINGFDWALLARPRFG